MLLTGDIKVKMVFKSGLRIQQLSGVAQTNIKIRKTIKVVQKTQGAVELNQ